MSRMTSITKLAKHFNRIMVERAQPLSSNYSTMLHPPIHKQSQTDTTDFPKNRTIPRLQIGENVPRKDKITFLVSTLNDLDDSKEAVYSTLDAWVAWERNFPIGCLKNVLLALEKEQQWHRMIQVIKWILSKGQGTTRGTYGQLIQALDMDHRVEEANEIWKKKLGFDLHSVPWKLCKLMISVYYRNNMLDELVKLFKGLEGFDRKPPEKSIVQKVADAYEMLGLPEEKERVLEKYKDLFNESAIGKLKTMKRFSSTKKRKPSRTG
ncbi:hypothetical protein BUALT_Bualt14G0107500 [Buddleja alternifolia]|uniref:Pentatricopeptide repeat-containing protein n=1 Tax=Buddleja alternifolia TaxID=168488 RepID=A0AAV6WPJ8_9LAMI|nr:hypothetical protein BUALT_Bualt14G0107500 [Buddleja alternifolia]